MVNPIAGHTRAEAKTNNEDGLRDGDVIMSPSLTNPYEGLHGNGILRQEDGAYGASDRNSVGSGTPGFITIGGPAGEVTVNGGHVMMDGTIYNFAGGPGATYTFTVGTTTNYSGTLPAVPANNSDVLVVVYLDSDSTFQHIKYEMGTPVEIATGTPLCPSQYLSDPGQQGGTPGTGSNQQHCVIGVIRYTMTGGAANVTASLSTTNVEVNDRRSFLRPNPVFFNHMTAGDHGNVTDTNAIDGANQKTLNTIFAGVEAGDFVASPYGAMWQSHSPDGHSVLYYSAIRDIDGSPTRNTWRLSPNEVKVLSTSANQTFKFDSPNIWILTPGAAINLNPTGVFPHGHVVDVRNEQGSGNTVTFDSTGLNQTVADGQSGRFVYDGTSWAKLSGGLDFVHVTTTGNDTTLLLESNDTDANVGPTLELYRNSGSPAVNDLTGQILFTGEDSGGAKQEYGNIRMQLNSVTAGAENGELLFYLTEGGATTQEYFRLRGGVRRFEINGQSDDIDFVVYDDPGNFLIYADAGTARVGIGTSNAQSALDVDGQSQLRQANLVTKNSGTTLVETEAGSHIIVTSNVTINLPSAPTTGTQYVIVRNTAAGSVTVSRSGSDTFIGGATSKAIATDGDTLTCVYLGSNVWAGYA